MAKYKLYIKNTKPSDKHPKGYWYLGKTQREDVENYLGSGKVWANHINKNNYTKDDIHTWIIWETNNFDELREMGLYYSKYFDVVNNSDWANLIDENGSGGFSKIASSNGGRIGGKKSGKENKQNSRGIFSMSKEEKHDIASKVGKENVKKERGIFAYTKEKKSIVRSNGGKTTMNSEIGNSIRSLGSIASSKNKECEYCGKYIDLRNYGKSHGSKCKNINK
jgi:hypothetical protein